ncbi:MAG: 30S ribosomal protein S20 [Nitrospira sp.]|nr:30S ribosomal protein S20 [bacterium]MBL7048820.1 30S ribosomal protein S20 [Nitrospira sp.]
MKRVKQSKRIAIRNKSAKTLVKTLTKKLEADIKSKNSENAAISLKTVVKAIDKASGKRVIHRNAAARKVSRLTKIVNAMLQPATA